MDYVNHNCTMIKTTYDLQNLVISTVLKQVRPFSAEDIYEQANACLDGSSFKDSEELRSRCEYTLSTLFEMGSVRRMEGNKYQIGMSFPVSRRVQTVN